MATRLAVTGMALAVVALGALSLAAAFITQNEAAGLTRVAVQTTGQLRALQALYVIRVETDALEEEYLPQRLAQLRNAQQDLPTALIRMGDGDAPEAIRVAAEARPVADRLIPAIDRFLADPRGDIFGQGDDDTAEDAMEDLVDELETLLNDSASDPADLLGAELADVTATGFTVSSTAIVLVPLGLGCVVACGLLLRVYRRRSESAMQASMKATAREARTDQLTGLPNRRGFLEELDRWIGDGRSFTLALADLNGFKRYNDTFGHPAGDALLRRLSNQLAVAWEGRGFAARLGGDEFCVLVENLAPDQLQALLQRALSDEGEGFSITSVSGLAAVPAEAADPSSALRLADTRLYAAKAVVHAGAPPAWGDVDDAEPAPDGPHLTPAGLIEQRCPGLGRDPDRLTGLAVICAGELGLSAQDVLTVERAAQLYDIGKIALPAAILTKRGALTEDEEQFLRRHSAIGERLLMGMDDLGPVAAVVRATHERWDGEGYPDQLSGEDIPIGARIIAVVDAFCAMAGERLDGPVRPVGEAIAELRRCSGKQFDPTLVDLVACAVDRDGAAEQAAEEEVTAERVPGGQVTEGQVTASPVAPRVPPVG